MGRYLLEAFLFVLGSLQESSCKCPLLGGLASGGQDLKTEACSVGSQGLGGQVVTYMVESLSQPHGGEGARLVIWPCLVKWQGH